MAYEPADGVLARYFCGESMENPCQKCAPRGGGMYFFIGKQAPRFTFAALGSAQRSRTLLSGLGVAREIDACSNVPSLEEELEHSALARQISNKLLYTRWQRALDLTRVKKIGEFWVETDYENEYFKSNQICNSIVLSKSIYEDCISGHDINPEDNVQRPTQNTITTHSWYSNVCPGNNGGHGARQTLADLLEEHGRVKGQDDDSPPCDKEYVLQLLEDKQAEDGEYDLWSDHCPDVECGYHKDGLPNPAGYRPFDIVDGQHRTRGVCSVFNAQYENADPDEFGICKMGFQEHSTSLALCEQDCGLDQWDSSIPPTLDHLPFTILPWGQADEQAKARVFTDITTRGEDMEPLHKLSMLWRFDLKDGKVAQWKNWQTEFNFEEQSIHNLAYELILYLCYTNTLQQTFNKIPPIITKNQNTLIDIEHLLRYHVLDWMDTGNILDHSSVYDSNVQRNHVASSIDRYLQGWAYWLSGPMRGPDAPANDQRIWTPTHSKWDHRQPEGDKHPHLDQAHGFKAGHKTSQRTGGYLQSHQQTPPSDMRIGKTNSTTLIHLVFDLFPTIVESILRDKYIAAGNNAHDWTPDMVSSLPTNVIAITDSDYWIKLQPMLDYESNDRIVFGTYPFENSEYNTTQKRQHLIEMLNKKFRWLP